MIERILYVDDNLETGRPRLDEAGVGYCEKNPEDVATDEAISRALEEIHLVLMDYDLHEIEHGGGTPIDGIELLERFRATIRRHRKWGKKAPLLTIYTNELSKLAQQHDECPSIPYMLARRANVDWVFVKQAPSSGDDPFGYQLTECLEALDADFQACGDDLERQLTAFLSHPGDVEWSDLALEQLLDARPPIHDLSSISGRTSVMRWLLHVALPFPGCFVDINSIAVRLRLDPKNLQSAIETIPDSEFALLLSQCEYKGQLSSFFSKRYWKAGVDHLIWTITRGQSPAKLEIRKYLAEMVGKEIPLLSESNPVLVVSPETFELTGEVAELKDVVQIQSELWPTAVEPPWIRIDEVKRDRKLRVLVVSKDRDRVGEVS